jgi:hypothetical protein
VVACDPRVAGATAGIFRRDPSNLRRAEVIGMRGIAIGVVVLALCGCGVTNKLLGRASDDGESAASSVAAGALATEPDAALVSGSADVPKAAGPVAPPALSDVPPAAGTAGLDTAAVEEAIGLTGATLADGVFRITRPRGDLKVTLEGFAITPRMGLAGWFGFRAHASGAALVGMLPVAADELPQVVSAMVDAGLEPTALHSHFVGEQPAIAFLHFGGVGNPVALARGVRDVLDAIVRVRAAHPTPPRSGEIRSDLDVAKLDAVLGLAGEHDGQVYRVTVPRPNLAVRDNGVDVGPTLGAASWAALQGTAERAALAGELMVQPSELQGVVHVLRTAHIGVVGIAETSTRAQPRLVFVAFWAIGKPEALAGGLRKALDQLAHGG